METYIVKPIHFFRANSLPPIPEPSSIYMVANHTDSNVCDVYIIGNTSSDVRKVGGGTTTTTTVTSTNLLPELNIFNCGC